MTTNNAPGAVISGILEAYIEMIEESFSERWEGYLRAASLTNAGEVMTGLLQRQVELATCFARSSVMWEIAVAPVLLRTMIETHLNLAWILQDPVPRADAFIEYGIGQAKLMLEHRRAQLQESGLDPDDDLLMQQGTSWLEQQRHSFFTTVNVGHWAEKDLRHMADEVGERSLYHLSYVPFSASVHSQWYHVARFNLTVCKNPLHGFHRVPGTAERPLLTNLYTSAKYLSRTVALIDERMSHSATGVSALEWLTTVLGAAFDSFSGPELGIDISYTLDDGSGF